MANAREEGEVLHTFIKLLAQQLTSSRRPASLHLEELLRQCLHDLPAAKLRSTLLQPHHFSTLVSALRHHIEASPRSMQQEEDGTTLLDIVAKEAERLGSVSDGAELSLEARRCHLSSTDPPLNLVWAMAALEMAHPRQLSATPFSTTALLLGCLKPLIVAHTIASTAVAALAPLVPVMFQALQECNPSYHTTTSSRLARKDIKALQSMLRQVFSFIVVCRNKEKYSKDGPGGRTQSLRLSSLLNGFSLLLRALKLRGQSDVLAVPDMLAFMFPLTSKRTIKSLQRPFPKVAKMAEIVTIEFVLLQLVLESIYWRKKLTTQGVTIEATRRKFMAKMRALAVHDVAATDHGNDIILDLLLSRSCVCNVLDDKENTLIKRVLYEALLVEVPHFGDMSTVTASARPDKICRTFLKKIAVARDDSYIQRSQDEQNYANDVLQGLHVPLELVQWLKRLKIGHKPPDNAIVNPRILIGWLLNLEDTAFKEIFDRVSVDSSKAKRHQEKQIRVENTLSNSAQNQSSKDIVYHVEPETLFFVDTTGEAERKDSSAVDTISTSAMYMTEGKKNRKRKKSQVLFHRRTSLTEKKESESMVVVYASDATEEDKEIKK